MSTATEILSQIFDKDGIKYKKTDNRIKIDSKDCSISIQGDGMGYNFNAKCNTETDRDITQLIGNLTLINKFEISRIAPDGLFVKGIESPMGKDVASVSFTAITERQIPYLQYATINCKYNECQLVKGARWE